MSYNSIGTLFSHNNGMEGEVAGSNPLCVCHLSVKKKKKKSAGIYKKLVRECVLSFGYWW